MNIDASLSTLLAANAIRNDTTKNGTSRRLGGECQAAVENVGALLVVTDMDSSQ